MKELTKKREITKYQKWLSYALAFGRTKNKRVSLPKLQEHGSHINKKILSHKLVCP